MSRPGSLDDPCVPVLLTGNKQHEAHAGSFHTRRHTALPSGGVSLPAQDDVVALAIELVVSSNEDSLDEDDVVDKRQPED